MYFELKIAICDDEKYYRTHIKELISNYLSIRDIPFHIDLYKDGTDFCKDRENVEKYDVVFLDIEMERLSGMETAHWIREKNTDIDIVFITIVADYVFEGYRVGAVRYIMKNELEALLPECLSNILKRKNQTGNKIEFSFVGGKRKILLKDIIYIESKAHKLLFVRKDENLYLYDQINNMEQVLKEFGFIRCHQSFIVNIEHIDKIKNYWIYLSDGTEIPASRPKYAEIRQIFLQYKEI